MVHIRSLEEVRAALTVQTKAIESSAKAFDEGARWEATRIATAVHTIVHDMSKRKPSLLTRLGVKQGMKFCASANPINPRNLISSTPLVLIKFGGGEVRNAPRCDIEAPQDLRYIAFSRWWKDEAIFSSGSNNHLLSRMNLTFALRHKEGGAHFDPVHHDMNYVKMTEGSGWMAISSDGTETPLKDTELVSMRQIGWEVVETLKHNGLYYE